MKKITLLFAMFIGSKMFAQLCDANSSSITFNGSGSYVDLGSANAVMPDSAVTIEAWINPAAFATNVWQNSIVNKDGWGSGEEGFALRCGGNGVLSFVICARTFASTTSLSWREVKSPTGSIPLNTWSHVAGVFDGDTLRCYVNGVQKATFGFTGMIKWVSATSLYDLMIGRCPQGLTTSSENRYFNGNIDEVRIWERALSASELQANMNNHINAAGQNRLLTYCRFNENTGAVVNDLSSQALSGVAYSTSWSPSVPFAGGLQLSGVTGNFNSSPMSTETYVVSPSGLQSYAWSIGNGSILSGQNNDTITVVWVGSGSGSLTVVGSDGACADTLVSNVTITPVGINSIDKSAKALSIAQTDDRITFTNNTSSSMNAQVYNSIGMLVKSTRMGSNASMELKLDELSPGVYVYSASSENNKMITGKFIKR
jgi:hypothetical protein